MALVIMAVYWRDNRKTMRKRNEDEDIDQDRHFTDLTYESCEARALAS